MPGIGVDVALGSGVGLRDAVLAVATVLVGVLSGEVPLHAMAGRIVIRLRRTSLCFIVLLY
jgi:hypothetical protein